MIFSTIRNIFLLLCTYCFIICAASAKNIETPFDPFREKFFNLRYTPTTPLKINKNPIPKIIHQFWIGDEQIPNPYIKTSQTCKNMEGFEYKLWTNENYKELLSGKSEEVTYNDIKQFGDKKDFLSFRALLKYGGVSLDLSMICVKAPTVLHESFSFYAMYPYKRDYQNYAHALLLHGGIVGASKGSPIIQNIIKKFDVFRVDFPKYNIKYTTFEDKNILHGWLSQILINEAVEEYCFKGKTACNDVKILLNEQGPNPKLYPNDIIFLDTDLIKSGYFIKTFYLHEWTIKELLEKLKKEEL